MLKTLVLSTMGAPSPDLLAFLRSVPGLALLNMPDTAAIRQNTAALPTPDLVILDVGDPKDDTAARIQALHTRLPGVRSIVLVSSTRQLAAAQGAGADLVLLAGFSAVEFCHALNVLLSRRDL